MLQTVLDEINKQPDHCIPFRRYMELVLYDPHLGYYSRSRQKIGKEGDFFTNVNVGAVFGECLADVFHKMIAAFRREDEIGLVEFGGGTGLLCRQILTVLRDTYPMDYERVRYLMVERSAYHREVQKEELREHGSKVLWLNGIEEAKKAYPQFSGIVFSNEFLDALPVHLIEKGNHEWLEMYVAWSEKGRKLVEKRLPCQNEQVLRYIEREEIDVLQGYRFEVNLEAGKWLHQLSEWIRTGYILSIDYGYFKDEWFIPERRKGTLMCYRDHQADEDPYSHPGKKDITAHVPFFSLQRWGSELGWKNAGYWTQEEFLLQSGILQKLSAHRDRDPFRSPVIKRNRAIQQLISPQGMGRTFKVLLQSKGIERSMVLI